MAKSADDVKIYLITIPAHKFLHIKNYESNGYWDFWQKPSLIPGQDCETVCGLLDSISIHNHKEIRLLANRFLWPSGRKEISYMLSSFVKTNDDNRSEKQWQIM